MQQRYSPTTLQRYGATALRRGDEWRAADGGRRAADGGRRAADGMGRQLVGSCRASE